MIVLNVVNFTKYPGPRLKRHGPYSGEAFYEEMLLPSFTQAVGDDARLVVDLDGTYGYASSFIDEAFTRLLKDFGKEKVEDILGIISVEENYWLGFIQKIIKESKYK